MYAFRKGFEGFPPPTEFMLTSRFRQNVVLPMLFDAFPRFCAPPLGEGNIECMISVRVFDVFW